MQPNSLGHTTFSMNSDAVRKPTVLIVDDDEDVRSSLATLLQLAGFDTAEAADGRAALEYLAGHAPPCLIIIDVMMPRMDGLRFREEQLRDPRLARIPVVFCTARGDYRDQPELAGSPLFCKPADPMELLDVARRCSAPPETGVASH